MVSGEGVASPNVRTASCWWQLLATNKRSFRHQIDERQFCPIGANNSTVEIADASATQNALEKVFTYFTSVDERFSTYKETSEISRINRGEIAPHEYSTEMHEVFVLAEKTKKEIRQERRDFRIFVNIDADIRFNFVNMKLFLKKIL